MITLCIPYYDAPQMLAEQIKYWMRYPVGVTVILVDDGSPTYPAIEILARYDFSRMSINVRSYCIKENIAWNIGGALNLAFTHAEDEWCISGAVDHALSPETMLRIMQMAKHPSKYYRFKRMDVIPDGEYYVFRKRQGCGNLFLMTRELFWRVGGYDEDFAGYYGGVGNVFKRQLQRLSQEVILDDVYWHHFEYLDGQVTAWDRDKINVQRVPKMKKKLSQARTEYNPVDPLRFTWAQTI